MKFANNRQLYDYLLSLGSTLKDRGAEKLSRLVIAASRQAVGMSTEFLGEARIALRQVAQGDSGVLSETEHADLLDALEQLDTALDKRGR